MGSFVWEPNADLRFPNTRDRDRKAPLTRQGLLTQTNNADSVVGNFLVGGTESLF